MTGHLDIVCGLDAKGLSQLRHQSFRAPMHISKPHLEGETLRVNVVNPTAGVFEGDEIACKVHVESGARLLLASPGATRAHCMTGEGEARMTQRFSVEHNGWLEVWPELFIPQSGTRYRQKTTVGLAEEGGLLLVETLAPGRVASGEAFQFQYLDWETDIFLENKLVAREKYHVSPERLRSVRKKFPTAYYACIFLFHPKVTADNACWKALDALHSKSSWIGHSRLHGSGWSIKILAEESIIFRKTLLAIRQICHEATGKNAPDLRKF